MIPPSTSASPEDWEAIHGYLSDPEETLLQLRHPPTGLRKFGGWALGGFGLLLLLGGLVDVIALAFGTLASFLSALEDRGATLA